MDQEFIYDKFIVQALIGTKDSSSVTGPSLRLPACFLGGGGFGGFLCLVVFQWY